MAKFLITYDNRPPRDYNALYRLMAAWGAQRLADSVWLVAINGDAVQVRDIVSRSLQHRDLVAVVELKPGSDWATTDVTPAASAWLSDNIAPGQKAA